jgi:signal transduction histidine kinase
MLQARDQLLLDVSHDLRSPLTRMKVALELMPDHKGSKVWPLISPRWRL